MSTMNVINILTVLITSAITNRKIYLDESIIKNLDEILSSARSQGILYLVCQGLRINNISIPEQISNELIAEIYQDTQNEYLFTKARKCFVENRIEFVPLKGFIIRYLYPEKYMRKSCDVDILVHEEELERAIQALVNCGFTTDYNMGYHDVSLFLGEAHLELHFNICEHKAQTDSILKKAWKYITQFDGTEWREIPSFFVFHTLTHMLYHFEKGGCGLRPFIDLWILKRNGYYREEELIPFLEKCDMMQFYRTICDTIEIWFEGKESNDLTKKIEKYISNGGTYGSKVNAQIMDIVLNGGKLSYLLRMAFLPLQDMMTIYPVLKTYPVLLPMYYARRICSKLFGKNKKQTSAKITTVIEINPDYKIELAEMAAQMGLK